MKTIRLIIMSNESGSETVLFTEQFETPAEDHCSQDQTVDFDQKIEVELPSNFPMGFELETGV